MRRKSSLLVFLSLLLTLSFATVWQSSAQDLPEVCQGQDGSGMKVGFGNLLESIPFPVAVREGIETVAADSGL